MRVTPGPAGPVRTGRSRAAAAVAGRGRDERRPGPAAQHNAPRRRESRAPPPQLCAASAAARPRPSARPPPRPPPSRPRPLTVAELEQRGRVVQAAVAREAVLHAEAAGQRPLPRPGRAAADHPHTEPPETRPALALGPALLWRPLPVTMATPGPPPPPREPDSALPARGRPRRGRGWAVPERGGAGGGVECPAGPGLSPERWAGARPRGRGCCGDAGSRSASSRRARQVGGRGDKGEPGGRWRRGTGAGNLTAGITLSPGPGNPSCGRRSPRFPEASSPRPPAASGPNMDNIRAQFGCLSTSEQLCFWLRAARRAPFPPRASAAAESRLQGLESACLFAHQRKRCGFPLQKGAVVDPTGKSGRLKALTLVRCSSRPLRAAPREGADLLHYTLVNLLQDPRKPVSCLRKRTESPSRRNKSAGYFASLRIRRPGGQDFQHPWPEVKGLVNNDAAARRGHELLVQKRLPNSCAACCTTVTIN